jgi:hypothetical protein
MTIRGPYGFVAEVAPGADPSASPSTWDFTSDGVRWRQRSGITFSTGRDDESSDVEAGSFAATFDARDGRLSPRNVLGPWYGLIGTNTPIRLMLPTVVDTFDRTVAAGSLGVEPRGGRTYSMSGTTPSAMSVNGSAAVVTLSAANTTATAALGTPGAAEVDIVSTSSISATPVGSAYVHAIMVRRVNSANFYRVHTEYRTDGTIGLKINRTAESGSGDLGTYVTPGVSFSPGTKITTRIRTIGRSIMIKVHRAVDPVPAAWQLVVQDDVVDGVNIGFFEWRLSSQTNTTTLTIDDFSASSAVYTGQVPEWPVRWPSKSGADCVTPVAASGILRWLKQGQPPLEAPIPQQLSSYRPQAYWRLDEGSTSTSAGDSVAFGFPARGPDVTFGNDDSPPGAVASASLNTAGTSRLSGTVRMWNLGNGDGATIMYFKLGSVPAAGSPMPLFEVRTVGTINRWVVQIATTGIELNGYDRDGIGVVTGMAGGLGIDPTRWWAISLEFEKFGSTDTIVQLNWHQVGSMTFYSAGTTQVNNRLLTRISDVTVIAPADNTLVSNVWVGPSTVPFVDTTFMQVSSAFNGETDVDRIKRVLGYAGIEVFVAPGAGRRLGPQPKNATVLDVVRDAELAGYGLLYERGAILGYLPWTARVNPGVTMALDWQAGHLDEAPEPTDDDQQLVNRWTSSRPDGGSRVAEDAGSIARRRLYADGETVNVQQDDQLSDDAGWHVAVGSVDSLRWPTIKINLTRNPSLILPWLACRVGSRITVANLPEQVAGEVADLIIEGFENEITTDYEWTAEIACSPAKPWIETAVWGSARGDSQSSELVTAVNATATTLSLRALVYEDTWGNPAAPGDYSVVLAGEPMPVQSATAPVLSGGYWTQTISVTRGSALAKPHAVGEPVRIATPKRWGMGY